MEALLRRLKLLPVPEMPVPADLGPLSTETSALNFEPVPPQFAQPAALDMNFVNRYAGAAPVAPVIPEPQALDKLAAILSGIGAGPAYGRALREEREEPIRRYEQQLERYQGRRAQGVELAERRSEREAERANRAAELAYTRDYNLYLKKLDIRRDEANERTRQAFELYRDARKEAENARKERVLLKRQIALQIDDRIKAYRDQGADKYAEELARNDFRMALGEIGEKVPPLSAAASKANRLVQAKIQRALRLAQGGGGSTGPVMAKLQNGQLVPLSIVNKDLGGVMLNGELVPVVDYVGGRIPGKPQQPQPFPETSGLPPGIGALTPQAPTEQDVRAYAKRFKMSREKARKELMGR